MISRLIRHLNNHYSNNWYVDGETLAYYCCNGTLEGFDSAQVSVPFLENFNHYGFMVEQHVGKKVETYSVMLSEGGKINLPIPKGTLLDYHDPDWHSNTPRIPYHYLDDRIFMTAPRRQNALTILTNIQAAAEEVGIGDKVFLAFGALLGYVMYGGFIPYDTDIDVGFLPGVTTKQRQQYQDRIGNIVDQNAHWCLVKPMPIEKDGITCCNLFFWEKDDVLWHSHDGKIAKGIPKNFLCDLVTIDFMGVPIQAPARIGAILDWWYPKWERDKKHVDSSKSLKINL